MKGPKVEALNGTLGCKDPDVRTQVPGCKYGDEGPCVDEVDNRYIGA